MNETLLRFASPEIERLLRKLQAAEEKHNSELRSREREKLVFPAQVYDQDGVIQAKGYTRDVSQLGLGLVTKEAISIGSEAIIVLTLPEGRSTGFQVKCCWAKDIENSLKATGWELKAESIDVPMLQNAQTRMKWKTGFQGSLKFSIPLMIRQKGKFHLVQGFACDLAGDGANLIASEKIAVNSFCKLKVFGSDGELYEIIAKCVSCECYAGEHWLVSFEFPRLDRVAKFHAACLA